ncbi:hypothetical protein [Lacrimispora sp.]|uniref:hypothetical protein n=1 Tax=Lacrimispora sp. TaxID=2719234 RepID=UPI0032E4C887
MESETNFDTIKDKYKELKVSKIIVNGEEHQGNVINAEATKDTQQLNVNVYTQNE